MTKLRSVFLIAAAVCGIALGAADSPWGIVSHPLWSKDPQDLEMEVRRTKEAGIRYYRTDFGFSGIAQVKGKYDFSRCDQVVDKLSEAGIEVLPVLQGYDWDVARHRADVVPLYKHLDEWRNYVRAVAEHYKGRIHAYEIWNEQDGGFWRPAPNAAQYVKLLKIAYREIKAADPDAIVIIGGMCYWNDSYMKDIYLAGGKGYFDAIAVHPYGDGPDASAKMALGVERFKALLAANGDADKELWITECGGSSNRSSLMDQQPEMMVQAIRIALEKIGRPFPEKLKVGALKDLENPGAEFATTREWLPGAEIVPLDPRQLDKLDPARIPVVIGCERLTVLDPYVKPLRRYVERGGVMIASGQVPFYVRKIRQPNGNWIEKDDAGNLHKEFRIGFQAWWTKKGLPRSTFNVKTTEAGLAGGIKPLRSVYSTRWMTDANLKPGDAFTPLVDIVDNKGRVIGHPLALYTFKDWKGAIIANTLLLTGGLSEAQQANRLQRVYLSYIANGVKRIFIYNLRNKGTNPAEGEDNFGIVRRDFTPKPAWHAFREMTAALGSNPQFVRNLSDDPAVWALLFKRAEDGKQVLAVWGVKPETVYSVDGKEYRGTQVRFLTPAEDTKITVR